MMVGLEMDLGSNRELQRAMVLTGRMQLVVTDEFVASVDAWRAKQPDVPNRSEAVRRMVEIVAKQDAETERVATTKRRTSRGAA